MSYPNNDGPSGDALALLAEGNQFHEFLRAKFGADFEAWKATHGKRTALSELVRGDVPEESRCKARFVSKSLGEHICILWEGHANQEHGHFLERE